MPLLPRVIALASRRWLVFPLKPKGKAPLIAKEKGGRGLYDATADPARIHEWWALYPQANVGIRTGAESGIVVVDCDSPEAEAAYAELGLPPTPTVRTARGHHYYHAHPGPGAKVQNRVRAEGEAGFDVRGDGGYVVGPGSIHPNGASYEWEPGTDSLGLAPWPTAPPRAQSPLRETPRATPIQNGPTRPTVAREGASWAEAALKNETTRVALAVAGSRNHTLNRASFSLGQIVAGGYLDRERVQAELSVAAERCGLLEADGAGQVRATIESGMKAGALEPRHPEPGRSSSASVAVSERKAHHRTDVGNAERLAARYGSELRYLHPWREWLVWDGKRWARDRSGELVRRARETIRALYSESAGVQGDDARRELAKHALASEAQRRIYGMIELAKADERIAALPESFDGARTRMLLNLENGTLDLSTGTLRPHDPADQITRLASVSYDAEAVSPAWNAFLERVVPDGEVRAFLQRFVGYSLTGDVSEQVFCLLHGTGANGKSTFLETILHLLGEYGHAASFESFLEATSKSDRRGGPRADLLALRGVRLVAAIEAGEGRRLDENVIKQLTGRDSITARGMYQAEETTFQPEAKLLLAGNHEPEIHGGDLAIWRRVLEVPFTITIPEDERDPNLLDALREPQELSGILNWALRGCAAWQAMGSAPRLRPPASVVSATRRYRDEQDRLRPFLDDCCVMERAATVSNGAFRQAYDNWCKANGERPVGSKRIARKLKELGVEPTKIGNTRCWLGISLLGSARQTDAWPDE